MDGFTFLEKFPETDFNGKEKTRLIVLTISHDRAGSDRALSLGAHGVLNKPLQLDQLQQIIGKD
jgi:DNA-binding NarL/FixJ family response regulator